MVRPRSLIFTFAILLCLMQIAMLAHRKSDYTYEDFQIQFSRIYTGQQREKHKQIFLKNYQEILQKRDRGESSEVNDYLDWNQTQLSQFFTYSPYTDDIPLSSPPLMNSQFFEANSNPKFLDYQNLGFTTNIKNQGSCGSCWAFAVAAQAQTMIALHNQKGGLYNLSAQYLLQCQKSRSKGCQGAPPLYAQKKFVSQGIPTWETYQYKGVDNHFTSRGINICSANNTIKFDQTVKVSDVKHYFKLSQQQIEDYLNKYGPLVVGVCANHTSFKFAGKDGLIESCSNCRVDHAVTLVGYTPTHYKIKNSWGTRWGNKGYGYINKKNDCGISTYVDAIEIQNSSRGNKNKSNQTKKDEKSNQLTPGSLIKIYVTLTSTTNYGFMGTILGFRQKGGIIARIGSSFIKGNTFGPEVILVRPDSEVRIILLRLGRFSQNIGFQVKFQNGTVIHSQKPGRRLPLRNILKIFCASPLCKINRKSKYTVKLKDSWGDSWNQASLAFKSGSDIQQFSLQKEGVKLEEPFEVQLDRFTSVDIVVRKMGEDTQEIGYEIRNQFDEIVAERQPGEVFFPDDILSSFCTDCLSLYEVEDLSGGDENLEQLEQNGLKVHQESKTPIQKYREDKTKIKETIQKPKQKTMIAVYILSVFLIFFMALTILIFVLLLKSKKQYQTIIENQNNEIMSLTRKHIEVSNNQVERID